MNLFPRPASQMLCVVSAGALKEWQLARFLLSGILMNLGLVMLQEWRASCTCELEFKESPKVRTTTNTASSSGPSSASCGIFARLLASQCTL